MSGRWMIALILGLLTGSPIVSAQRSAQALNYNVREGKHDVGGFGAGFLLGAMVAGDMYRAQVVSDIGGGGRLGDGTPLTRNETVAGISFEYQMGTDSDIAGTNLALDLVSHAVEITDPDPTGFGTISKTATIAKFGFDWVFNFYKSEFVERDGRRSRSNFNLSMLLGIDLGFFLGDFDSLNGLSTVGFDLGVAMDIPLTDSFQIDPALWLEMNYHLSDQVDIGTHDSTDTGLSSGAGTTRNLDGVLVRSHNFLPSYLLNIGGDVVFTPTFIGERGNLINSWRFTGGLYLSAPMNFNTFAADLPGDPLYTDLSRPTYFVITFGASYFW